MMHDRAIKHWTLFFLCCCAAILLATAAGCQQLGFRTESTQDKIAAAQTAVGAAYGVVADLVTAGKVSQDEGKQKYLALRDVEASLRIAETAARSNDIATAEGRLKAANEALAAINAYLQAKRGNQ